MIKIKEYDLPCFDGRKSFGGKAKVIKRNNVIKLQSLNTIVGYVKDNKFHRTWPGYSATTMRHVNSFCQFLGVECGGKAWWTGLEVEPINF